MTDLYKEVIMDESENKEMSTNSSVSHETCIENLDTKIETISLSPNSSVSDDSSNFRKFDSSSNSFAEFHLKDDLPLPKLEPSKHHTILFVPHNNPDIPPEPYPDSFKYVWDEDHVQLPCSSHNKLTDTVGIEESLSRWNVICKSLKRKILSSKDLEEAIMVYNSEFKKEWNFNTLHKFFSDCLPDNERENFFTNILPRMIDITLDLPKICPQPIPFLKKNIDHYITISQKQIGCLLLNAFFCTFPGRYYFPRKSKNKDSNRYPTYPDVNFNRLYLGRTHRQSSTLQKLKCLINYFTRIVTKEPTGSVTFHRQSIQSNKLPDWKDSTKSLRSVSVDSEGFIETEGQGLLQVDFANKLVGGGVLRTGCVQEEIRFVTCPELIVSRLFVEMLGLKEALIINGVEQYNLHSGYSDTFKWEGDFCDHTPRDAWGRRCTEIVAINATSFNIPLLQYKTEFIEKELNKAYCGFYQDSASESLSGIATGNWGCGAFKGDPHLKFLIQLMAASEVNRDLVYFTFRDKLLEKELKEIYSLLVKKKLSVGDLYKMLTSYGCKVSITDTEVSPKLYQFFNSELNL